MFCKLYFIKTNTYDGVGHISRGKLETILLNPDGLHSYVKVWCFPFYRIYYGTCINNDMNSLLQETIFAESYTKYFRNFLDNNQR